MKRLIIITLFILYGVLSFAQIDSTYHLCIGADWYSQYYKGYFSKKTEVPKDIELKSLFLPAIGVRKTLKKGNVDLWFSYGRGNGYLRNQMSGNQNNTIKSKYQVYRLGSDYKIGLTKNFGIHLGIAYNNQKESLTINSLTVEPSTTKSFLSFKAGVLINPKTFHNLAMYLPIIYERYNGMNLIGTSFRIPIIKLNKIFK